MITITEIGITAGDVWRYLDEKGTATLGELCKEIGKPRDLFLMSLGWLAREGYIVLQSEGKDYRATFHRKKE
ncbi:MAG: winged helix-turn-helix domain-containing protein [Candidatus Omnitrophica bacterium]|nr:winged helix-turn-helix domain-containing protein [Candidatus Omnitrophota bacterium]